MKSKDFEPKFQPDFEDYDEDEYEEKPKKGGWWRLPVGVIVFIALGCAVGGGVFATGKLPSKTAVVETESTAETKKTYKKTEKKESKISVMITTDEETTAETEAETLHSERETVSETDKVADTQTVIKLLIKDEDGRTSIDETEVPLNKLTEIGSLKKGSYILYIMRVPVSEKGTTYTIADNGIRFEVTGDGMPVQLELKLSSSEDGSTKVEVTNSEDSGVTYSYVDTNDYYYDYSTPQGGGSSTTDPGSGSTEPGGGSTEPGGGSTEPGGGSTEPGGGSTEPGGGSTEPGGGSTDPGDGGSTDPGDGGSTDPGDGGYTDPGDGGYDGGSDGGYDGGADYSVEGGMESYSVDYVETAE